MARYFFDWRDNEHFDEDDEGVELPDLEAVKVEASRSLIERARYIAWTGIDIRFRSRSAMKMVDRFWASFLFLRYALSPQTSGSTSS
jgi:hypothetical protein